MTGNSNSAYDLILGHMVDKRNQLRIPTGVAPGSPYQHRADGAAQALNDMAVFVSSLPADLFQALPGSDADQAALTVQAPSLPALALNRSEAEYIIQAILVREERAARNDNPLTPNAEGAESIIRHLRTAYNIPATEQLPAISDSR